MSALPRLSTLLLREPGDSADAPEWQLWPALTRGLREVRPPESLDFLSERFGGWRARKRVRRLDFQRAERLLDLARGHRSTSSGAITLLAHDARDRVVLERESDAATDQLFALAIEAVRRVLGFELHPVQILAALAMGKNACAELATGEGKTATAVLTTALRACAGRGVHVVTVNDYLAKRDADLNRPALAMLGFSVGVVTEQSDHAQRREAYAADVTYASDKQVIFDHLRDRLHSPLRASLNRVLLDAIAGAPRNAFDRAPRDWARRLVHRGLHAAIIDEADSVLIDEAVTPAIISEGGPGKTMPPDDAAAFLAADAIAADLELDRHYRVDISQRRITLTPDGIDQIEHIVRARGGGSPPGEGPRARRENVTRALSARVLHSRDDDYIVRDGKVMIVDRSTGRVLEGRQWQLGLHQAVEAKERVALTPERRTAARSSYQAFFRRYRHLAGMSGTCWEVRHELWAYYQLPVARIPTNRPVIRTRAPDRFFASQKDKLDAVVAVALEHRAAGRPVLIGTRSVATSELLGTMLREHDLQIPVLNANREAEEAAIIQQAGVSGAITVATNMAGRGTDIRLDDAARGAGGLVVIATERHEESRVDRQLFGRSGRQGDPGHAIALVSLDDQLVQRFVPSWLARVLAGLPAPLRERAARVVWPLAQRAAGRRAVMIRAEQFKAEAKFDLALQYISK